MNSTSDDLALKMDENRNNLKEAVEKYTTESITDITAEDEKKLISGEITVEEISEKYNLPLEYLKDSDIEETTTHNDDNLVKEPVSVPQSGSNVQPDSKAIDKAISDGVSKMYALKAKYVNKLGEVEREVYEEYSSLPEEKQNEDSKYKILMGKLDYVAQLESKCDNEVAKVISDLEIELKELNGDTEIIKVLRDSYKQEKELKKSYYLSLYKK
jgi:hypothetical protein